MSAAAVPSGLDPTGPPRPRYREPHPVRPGAVLVGVYAGAAWLVLFALLGDGVRGQAWLTVAAGVAAWVAALALLRRGDRGVAVGLSVAVAVGWAALAATVAWQWARTGDWPLW